jgi:hypothetical protein
MKGIFWNIRGLNKPGRQLSLEQIIRDNHVDFIGIQETKKIEFQNNFVRNLPGGAVNFEWHFLPTRGAAGGILVGFRSDNLVVSNVVLHNFSLSCMVLNKKYNFSWKLVLVDGSPYEGHNVEFIDELHNILASWQGAIMIGGDFNLSRCP